MVHVMLFSAQNVLYLSISTFRSVCVCVYVFVQCQISLFYILTFISCFGCMLLRYFLNDFEVVPVVPNIIDIVSVFTFHMRCISIVRSIQEFRKYALKTSTELILFCDAAS